MKRTTIATSLLVVVLQGTAVVAADFAHHAMQVAVDPATHRLEVVDRLTLPAGAGESVEFLLNAALAIEGSEPPLREVPLGDFEGFFGINAGAGVSERVELKRYRVDGLPEDRTVTLRYSGAFDFGLSDEKEQYTRGFRETAGIVGPEGVYLAGSGFWYPHLGEDLVTFAMEVGQPDGWHVISQGDGASRGEDGRARWDSAGPADEIYLVGGPLVLHRDMAGAVEALVYLHERDDALAGRYLEATAQYVEMYRELIGPYPYGKFALVENFWETGYGMPSFTVLGPTVIRLPFILHSSYPHEILHNWWGNSVFVDYRTGNWCEGLTAYMADHLIKEQRGQGDAHRRDTLQKYRNYVRDGSDFPLVEFRSRHSAATEAVGYGKTLMVFHMLRRKVGDDAFRGALARFYRDRRGKRAAFADLRAAFEAETETDLAPFFEQWTRRPGAPALRLEVERVLSSRETSAEKWAVIGRLEQLQDGPPFALDVPVVLLSETGIDRYTLALAEAGTSFALGSSGGGRPLYMAVDPQFDLFRLLDPREIPPSIGQVFGEPEILAVLPSAASEEERGRYRELVEGWQSDSHAIEFALDGDLEALPADRAAWVLGRGNRFAETLFVRDEPEQLKVGTAGGGSAASGAPSDAAGTASAAAGLASSGQETDAVGNSIDFAGERVPFSGHSIVAVRRHPADLERAVGWIVVGPPAAFPGMGRKLPHYGKYSYLAFEGDEPTNVVKGQWAATGSPLAVDLRPQAERGAPLPAVEPETRAALAELPPVFSQKALMEHVAWLAAPERAGRGLGSNGGRAAAEYVAQRFETIGLQPGGDDGGWFQKLTVSAGPAGEPVETVNVVGYLAGGNEAWREQSVVLAAHYDHLGSGWPDVHQGDEGRLHPGADDNASGVAVLLELASGFASGEPPARNLVFVAFGAEEAGRLGSKHYAERGRPFPAGAIRGVINLDTVGRLDDGPVTVLGTGTADEWQHIFRGCSFVTGVESRNVPGSAEGSDQWSFIERGVPAVQIFTQAHEDYHRPGDTVDKVDGAGLVKVATFVREAVAYLVEREEPLTVTIAATSGQGATSAAVSSGAGAGEAASGEVAGGQASGQRPAGGRRVSFGSVPDFAYPGPGVRLTGVVSGSPAEAAGLREGDVLLRLDDTEIADLRQFAGLLRRLEPGQTVRARVRRGEEEIEVPVTLEAR